MKELLSALPESAKVSFAVNISIISIVCFHSTCLSVFIPQGLDESLSSWELQSSHGCECKQSNMSDDTAPNSLCLSSTQGSLKS